MKRIGNIFERIISLENLRTADRKAQKDKQHQAGVIAHNENAEAELQVLHEQLKNKQFHTSAYRTFTIYEPKEREISELPFYPDRIVHHAIMNELEKMFVQNFISQTYSCIKGRGIHGAFDAVKCALRDERNTQYCLKMDVRKFYPSVDHDILKSRIRRKIKCADTLWLLDEIIDSTEGLPIGNYLSQYFGNFYLSGFDHWLKENKAVKYYFRYADDLVILAPDKPYLHALLSDIKQYLNDNLKLQVKGNYQVFPVEKRGIDFVGYVFRHSHIRLRKSIKQNCARMVAKYPNRKSKASYHGWLIHADCRNLEKKLFHEKV